MNLRSIKIRLKPSINSAVIHSLLGGLLTFTIALSPLSTKPAVAQGRVLQVLGACNGGQAQYIGNENKGRSQLVSSKPSAEAGFVIEGLEGKQISQLLPIAVYFQPPATSGSSEFLLRLQVAGQPFSKVYKYFIGPNSHPGAPVISTFPDGRGKVVQITRSTLLELRPNLKATDVIEKISFIFEATGDFSASPQIQEIDTVLYYTSQVPLLLEPVTCILK